MPQHNGYKTVGPRGTLAQLHPSCATLTPDEDGMLPHWVVYHELMQTARTFISKASCSLTVLWKAVQGTKCINCGQKACKSILSQLCEAGI